MRRARRRARHCLSLGSRTGALGDNGRPRRPRDVLERALPIYEREYGNDHAEVAGVLNDLGNAYGD